jgi:hypothetical protein
MATTGLMSGPIVGPAALAMASTSPKDVSASPRFSATLPPRPINGTVVEPMKENIPLPSIVAFTTASACTQWISGVKNAPIADEAGIGFAS